MRKRMIGILLALMIVTGLAACGNTEASETENTRPIQTESSQAQTGADSDSAKESTDDKESTQTGKILIAYFAVAENSEVDAISSASVTEVNGEAKGLVRTIAEDIQAVTGGDLFSIETSVDYPGDINDLIEYASGEQEEDVRPELTSHIENLDEYDTIFVGYPLWWYDLPQVMYSFFDEYNFSGKTIIPFDVHRGSRLSGTPDTIQELEPEANVISDGFAVVHETAAESVSDVAADVEEWLHGLGF
jgi:flavodoxin